LQPVTITTRYMNKFLKQNLLPLSVFITGACVLIIEVVAVRVLSPHYGNTIFTVSSVISVILAALSIGYYIGGKFADKYPVLRWFFGIILVSGLLVITIHFIGAIILPILSVNFSLITGPLISSLLLFLIPALLLGTLSPYAIKLQSVQVPEQGIGSISGKVFFWSTLGSILGSLLAGFVLIPNFGIDYIFIGTGIALFLLGFIPLVFLGINKKWIIKSIVAVISLTGATIFIINQTKADVLYSKDGIYENITIFDTLSGGRPIRVFKQDKSLSGAMFLDSNDPTDLVYNYTRYYSLYKIFNPEVKNALVIGGGAYSIPKALSAELPNATIDISEIEPSLFNLAKQYFDLKDNLNFHNYTEDGRRLLRDSNKKYDLIFSDVYYSLFSIPAHFTTQEFFITAKEKLSDNGVFIANLIGNLSRQKPSLIFSEIRTFRSVFPNSYFFATENPNKTGSQNIIFVGHNSDKQIDLSANQILQNKNPIISSMGDKLINLDRYNLDLYPILTDNYAPVDYMTADIIQRTFNEPELVDGDEMLATIEQQLSYAPRYIGSTGHKKTQDFLNAEIKELAHETIIQSWNHEDKDKNNYGLMNIIGRFYPNKEKRLILATHYDSKEFADLDLMHKDKPVPGANDSASGVSVLVEIARILNNNNKIPSIGIDIVFFDGEEGDIKQNGNYRNWVPLGSTYFSEHLNGTYKNNKPTSALVLDMVCDKNLKIYKEESSVKNAPKQVEFFWNIAKNISNESFGDKVEQTIRDDHTPLNNAGIPSFLVIDFNYPPFHTTGDTLDKCSAQSLERVANAVLKYIYSIQ